MAAALAWKVFLCSTWSVQAAEFAALEAANELQASLEAASSPFTTNPCAVQLELVMSTTTGSTTLTTVTDTTTAMEERGLTSLAELMTAGSTFLNVTRQEGFLIGQDVVVGRGTNQEEVHTIVGFGSIILERPLRFAHPAGTMVEVHLGHSALPPNIVGPSGNLQGSRSQTHIAKSSAPSNFKIGSRKVVAQTANQQVVPLLFACAMIIVAIGLLAWHCKGKGKEEAYTTQRTMSNFSRPDAEENRRMTSAASASELSPLGTPRTPALGGYAVREPGIISVGMSMGCYREDRSGGRFGLVSPSANS